MLVGNSKYMYTRVYIRIILNKPDEFRCLNCAPKTCMQNIQSVNTR